MKSVEANTVRLQEHGHDVLVLEKIKEKYVRSLDYLGYVTLQSYVVCRYSVVLGTPDKVIDHLIDKKVDETEIEGCYLLFLSSVIYRDDCTTCTLWYVVPWALLCLYVLLVVLINIISHRILFFKDLGCWLYIDWRKGYQYHCLPHQVHLRLNPILIVENGWNTTLLCNVLQYIIL